MDLWADFDHAMSVATAATILKWLAAWIAHHRERQEATLCASVANAIRGSSPAWVEPWPSASQSAASAVVATPARLG